MFHRKPRTLLLRLALPVALLASTGAAAGLLSLPGTASAVPGTATVCTGDLTPNTTEKAIEPDLLNYSFNCSSPITAYSVIIDRVSSDEDNVDDYDPNPLVYNGAAVDTNTSIQCGGSTPSNGINCYSLSGATAGPVPAEEEVEGYIDPTSQYCSYLKPKSKPGTPAVPRAIVELVVTDSTGSQDGPFELSPAKACAKVPAVTPAPKTKKKTKTKKTKSAGSTAKAAVAHAGQA